LLKKFIFFNPWHNIILPCLPVISLCRIGESYSYPLPNSR
jgi:hypothetical protein